MTKEQNIIPYRKKRQLNIGIIIFGIIFIYLVATIVIYLTAPHITVYEVRQGSILKDNAYTGLALREETVVYAEESGYINYFAEEESKVRVGTRLYTVSENELAFDDTDANTEVILSEEEQKSLLLKIQLYNEQFTENNYAATYQTKSDLENVLKKIASQTKADQLNEMLSSGSNPGLSIKTSVKDGIVVYAVDGMEELNTDTVSSEHFSKTNYKRTEFDNNSYVTQGEPIYKIITNDSWKLLVEITEETKNALTGKNVLKVNFKKDNQAIQAQISFLENANNPILCLSFEDSMVRYVNDRYLDIELILEDESGLKIPKSAETSKDFYLVPNSYITQGGNSSSDGVMRRRIDSKGKEIIEFLPVTVYYEIDEMVYLDPNAFEDGDVLIKTDSAETLELKEMRSLNGVYCINKGYAVFKQIKILCESDEYYIIEEGNSFGLSNYDHIALDSISIQENDVVF